MDIEKHKILTIDDNPEIHDLVERTLQGTEFSVLKANSGREGILIAKEEHPAVILLDIMMPDFDGFMTGKVLKRNINTKFIPIIFLSAKKTKEDINKAIQAGGSDYIMKPFSPSDLLTRLRRTVQATAIHRSRDSKKTVEHVKAKTAPQGERDKPFLDISMKGKVVVIRSDLNSILLENCKVYRDAFVNIISDGKFRIVLDTSALSAIDGAGLALLISANESLKKYGGGLRLIYPPQDINKQFSFINLSDLFTLKNDIESALKSFGEQETEEISDDTNNELNVCLSCTFVNAPKARYCSFCGSNLVLGKGEEVLTVLSSLLSKRIFAETQTRDITHINRQRKFEDEGYSIPSEFIVEIVDGNLNISYKSGRTDTSFFESQERIGIHAPVIDNKFVPIRTGMSVRLANPQVGTQARVTTTIDSVDPSKGTIYVHYNEDSLALHSMKNFSVAPKNPFAVNFTVPTLQHAGEIYSARILELSRVRMIVFAEKELPLNQCMALNFSLPGDIRISSPLAVAQKGRQRYMYNIEFRLVDEKESTLITKYMYKRQIELAKSDRE